jgi:hypothetical protein
MSGYLDSSTWRWKIQTVPTMSRKSTLTPCARGIWIKMLLSAKWAHVMPYSVLPIVDGPPGGYKGFAPTNHSVIELDDFP